MTEEHVFDQLPAYALGSLDEAETLRVIQHLDGCAVCRAELYTYQEVTNRLGFAAPLVEPPSSLKQKALQAAQPKPQPDWTAEEKPHFPSLFHSLFSPWRVAGLVLVLVLVASNLFLWQQVQQLRTSSAATAFQSIALVGTTADRQAQGMVVISKDGQYGTLIVQNLPPLDTDHQYQLWLIQDGKRTSGGVFSVPKDGYASMWVYSPQPLANYTSFGITIEPSGGSHQPTGAKVLGSD